ncbi:MAG: sigma-70 family RNA polymerase sigma factor [Phycisphaerales bacterium]|nr:sigma-70 family RNA polymerase sigma factor [Phycisphaerales bacterium]
MSQAIIKLDPSDDPSPEELARRAQGGDVGAFESIVDLYAPRLIRYVHRRVGDLHTAEDLVQDTFLKAFGALGGYDSARSLSTWLFTIATRVAISHGRRRFEISVAAPSELSPGVVNEPALRMSRQEEHDNIWDQARDVLPDSQFAVLWLKYAEEMPVNQIAEIIGHSQSNVKVMLHRGRKRLAQCSEMQYHAEGAKATRRAPIKDEANYVG